MFNVAESRKICDEATRGDWFFIANDNNGYSVFTTIDGHIYKIGETDSRINAAFITHARTALPAALDRIEELEKELEAAKGRLAEYEAEEKAGLRVRLGEWPMRVKSKPTDGERWWLCGVDGNSIILCDTNRAQSTLSALGEAGE